MDGDGDGDAGSPAPGVILLILVGWVKKMLCKDRNVADVGDGLIKSVS